jgi:SAM-dependent methyltransferase
MVPTPKPPVAASKFDAYANNYEALHQRNIAATGEDPDYFHQYKLARLVELGVKGPILDYGCGIGNLTRHLVGAFEEVHGVDPSSESLEVAKRRAPEATFSKGPPSRGYFQTAVLAGVLHHVPKVERLHVLRDVFEALGPEGRVVVFEHNPLNPLTRRAVRDCPFDDDAVLLWPWELRNLLHRAGFVEPRLSYIVFFPRALAPLRPLEKRLDWLWLGAQTMTVARR